MVGYGAPGKNQQKPMQKTSPKIIAALAALTAFAITSYLYIRTK
jgi:membrane-anchored glycerophosphoryl diester phosphodiesterase (GDPDase)